MLLKHIANRRSIESVMLRDDIMKLLHFGFMSLP